MYHLKISHLHENEGGSELGGWGAIEKNIKKCDEFSMNSALARPNNSFKNAINVGFFLLPSSRI